MKKIEIPEDIQIIDTDLAENPFVMDPKGFFLIRIQADIIEVGHVELENYRMVCKYIGKDPLKLYKKIIADIDIRKDHCAYLGYELASAKYCIDNAKTYVQG
jgi:hypothetical protein